MTTASPQSSSEAIPKPDVDLFPYPPTDLPYDDGEPLETPRHRFAMNLLIDSLIDHWRDREDYFVGGNMFLYYSSAQVKNQDFRGPDFFAVQGVEYFRDRKYWAIWDEGGKYPDVIIELMSDSTAQIDKTDKKQLYERTFKTADYFIYDPYDTQSLQGWHLDQNQHYQEIIPDDRGWLWSPALNLWLGLWEGEVYRQSAAWLRFYDPQGHLVLLSGEAAQEKAKQAQQQAEQAQQQAESERLRADRLAWQLKSLGVSPTE